MFLMSRSRDEPNADLGPSSEPDSESDPESGSELGPESGQVGDVSWSVSELSDGGWEWRAWRWTAGFSQSGWKDMGVVPNRISALILAKRAADDLAELDGDRIKAVEDEMISLRNRTSTSASQFNSHPPLKRVFMERRVGPKVSYGINIYEDDLTRQDGRYIAYLVIPEAGENTISRSDSEANLADGGARIEGVYDLLMSA